MPRATLKKLGLSDNEVQIYLTTLSLGQALVSTIANKCGIKRTSCYAIIEKLAEKGFLTSFTKSGSKYYAAVDPEALVDKCKNKVNEAQSTLRGMEKILPFLSDLSKDEDKVKVQFFDGFEGFKSMLNDLIQKNTDVKALIYTNNYPPKVIDYLSKEYFPKRAEFMTNLCQTIILDDTGHEKYTDEILSPHPGEIRTISEEALPIQLSFQLYDGKVDFYTINESSISGIKIENEQVFATLSALFDYVWSTSKN